MYYRFKILIAGDGAVGKTSLVNRFIKRKFYKKYEATKSVDILRKKITNKRGDEISLVIWDIAGQTHYDFLRGNFYKGSDGLLLMFDLTRLNTFQNLYMWLQDIEEVLGKDVPKVLIGNKVDLVAEVGEIVPLDKITELAEKFHLVYREASAKTGLNVEVVFKDLTEKILKERERDQKVFQNMWKTSKKSH